MTEDQDTKDSQSDSGTKLYLKSKDKKAKAQRPLTKIILRRLPPTMTEEAFLEQVSPIPEHDHFYFAKPDPSLGHNLTSRAYINFVNIDDIYLFRDKFDGYVFVDEKGIEYVGIVEYAPFQRIPKKKKKKDPKCGTIESDPIFQEFIENLTKEPETENQPKLEYSYPVSDVSDKKNQSTPLLEYLAARKLDKRGRDERRRRENDKRKMRIERKTKDTPIKEEEENDIKKVKSREWDKDKTSSDSKDEQGTVYESTAHKEQRKAVLADKKKERIDKREEDQADDGYKRDKKDKSKESPREQKSKKYSDTRKERIKQTDIKPDKPSLSKITSDKTKSFNQDDIKPFTQLPQVKTDDFTKIMEGMERKKKQENADKHVDSDESTDDNEKSKSNDSGVSKLRRSSIDSSEMKVKDDSLFKRQKFIEDRSKSSEREGSEEKDKSESAETRAERRIRNKDRPSLAIYQPGMGRFSKQRLAKEKDAPAAKSVSDSEKKDT